ncbi:MAG: hypothetical protein H0U66_17160 [Gemmatimonadaceae bacterium]|nr:hypothetical protein [Gemmatimonadaceae bacterium]
MRKRGPQKFSEEFRREAVRLASDPKRSIRQLSGELGVMAGATVPIGLLKDATASGWNAGAFVNLGVPLVPVSLRLEAQWHHMGGAGGAIACTLAPGGGFCPEPIEKRIVDGTANLVYTFPSVLPLHLYLIGGAGVYEERAHTENGGDAHESATKFGVNAGAGDKFQLGTFGGFVEARYHNIIHGSDIGDYAIRSPKVKSLQFVPISAGITF